MRHSLRHSALCAALLVACVVPLRQARAADARLDGSWRLVGEHVALKPVSGPVPFTKAGRDAYDAHLAAAKTGDYSFDLTQTRCSSPGLPRVMLAPGRMKIYVRDDIVMMRFEWNRLFRQIGLGSYRREPAPKDSPVTFDRSQEELLYGTMMGKTYGRWEGPTLVAESDGFGDNRILDNLAPASDDLKLVERFRLRDNDTLEDRITISDSVNYTRPWDAVLIFKRVANERIPQDVCLDRKLAKEPLWPR